MTYTITAEDGFTTTRKTLRQDVGYTLGDLILLTATSNGSTTTFLDNVNCFLPNSEYRGTRLYFTSGSNSGLQATVTDSTQSTGTLTFSPARTSTTTGNTAELWNWQGNGFLPDNINMFIQQAHREAMQYFPLPALAEESDAFDRDYPFITIPDTFRAVTGLQWLDSDENWRSVARAKGPGKPGYWVDKAGRSIVLNGGARESLSDGTYRVRGYTMEAELTSDTSETVVNAEWLRARVCELACTAMMNRMPELRDKVALYKGDAQLKRTMIVGRGEANVDRVG